MKNRKDDSRRQDGKMSRRDFIDAAEVVVEAYRIYDGF
jgi:hypothetical protein